MLGKKYKEKYQKVEKSKKWKNLWTGEEDW
jgi:hypothetical protein